MHCPLQSVTPVTQVCHAKIHFESWTDPRPGASSRRRIEPGIRSETETIGT
jgi:hypothetical protein